MYDGPLFLRERAEGVAPIVGRGNSYGRDLRGAVFLDDEEKVLSGNWRPWARSDQVMREQFDTLVGGGDPFHCRIQRVSLGKGIHELR